MEKKQITLPMSFNRKLHGIVNGYRSGLEEAIATQLSQAGAPYEYESIKIDYETPATKHKYTPDFILDNGIIIETKGRFLPADRKKHLLIKQQHPSLDIRFVFTNAHARISKASKTTNAAWCEKYGFRYAHKRVPEAWLTE